MTDNIIEARKVNYAYSDGTAAIKDLDLTVEQGKKLALVGPNGAGKSTLMLMFNGILRPTKGEILFKGEPIKYDSSSLRNIRRKVGMVFQNPDDQIFAPTVYQDVAFGPVNLGFPREKIDRYVNYALSYVGMSGCEKRPPHHLSGGEKKRVAIAGVLAMEPDVMVLDEPTSNLDPAGSEEIMEMLDEINCGGKTVIISTHDVELAYRWADEIILMENGSLLKRGRPSEVFYDHDLITRARMKTPLIVEIYRALKGRGVLDGDRPPKNLLELTDRLVAVKENGIPFSALRSVSRPTSRSESESTSKLTSESTSESTPASASSKIGSIFVYNVDQADPAEIRGFIEKSGIDFVGAMGSMAKILAGRQKIPLDFTYGVIDKCILKALAGKSSLIITSGGMVGRALSRIEAYSEENRIMIETLVLND